MILKSFFTFHKIVKDFFIIHNNNNFKNFFHFSLISLHYFHFKINFSFLRAFNYQVILYKVKNKLIIINYFYCSINKIQDYEMIPKVVPLNHGNTPILKCIMENNQINHQILLKMFQWFFLILCCKIKNDICCLIDVAIFFAFGFMKTHDDRQFKFSLVYDELTNLFYYY